MSDPFGLFNAYRKQAKARAEAEHAAAGRRIGKLERNALADLDLPDTADGPAIRARYTELVKRCHPDANGGDRGAEDKLREIIQAYNYLKQAGLV